MVHGEITDIGQQPIYSAFTAMVCRGNYRHWTTAYLQCIYSHSFQGNYNLWATAYLQTCYSSVFCLYGKQTDYRVCNRNGCHLGSRSPPRGLHIRKPSWVRAGASRDLELQQLKAPCVGNHTWQRGHMSRQSRF